jgi:hypothetical protein
MKFFAVLLSLQLIVAPVLAQTASTQTAATTTAAQAPTGADGKPITDPAQASQVQHQKNPEYDKNSQTAGGFEFYSRQLLSVANSVIGANIITRCSFGMKVPSIAMFWAASLTYIVSEIANGGKAQNKDQNNYLDVIIAEMKKDKSERKGGGNGDVQREVIEKRLADEKRTSKLVDDRTMWLSAVAAMYVAAAVMAILEETSGTSAAMATGTSTCAGLASTCGPQAYAGCFAACMGTMPLGHLATKPMFASPEPLTTTAAACGPAAAFSPACLGAHAAYHTIAFANCSPLWPQYAIFEKITLAGAVGTAYSMAFGHASGDGPAGYVKMMIGIMSFFIDAIGPLVQAAYNYPIPRSVTFGVNGALTVGIIAGLKQRQNNVIKPNIQKLTALRDSFRQQTDDIRGMNQYTKVADAETAAAASDALSGKGRALDAVGSTGTAGGATAGETPVTPNSLEKLADAASSRTCAAQTDKGLDVSGSACANPLRITRPAVSDLRPNDKALVTTTATLATDLANELASGNTERARVLAGEVGAKLSALSELYDRKKVELNEHVRAKGGKKDFDYQTEMNQQLTKLQDQINKQATGEKLAALPPNFRVNLTDLGAAGGALTAEAAKDAEGKESARTPKQEVVAVKPATPEAATEAPAEEAPMDEAAILAAMDEHAKLSEADQKAAAMNGYLDLDDKLRAAGKGQEGISPVADASLFKQISNRYLRSLDRILSRKKHALPAPPAKKATAK